MTDPNPALSDENLEPLAEIAPAETVADATSPDSTKEQVELTPEQEIAKLRKALERKNRNIAKKTAELSALRNAGQTGEKDAKPSPQAPATLKSEDFDTIEEYVGAVADQKAKDAAKAAWESSRKEQTEREQNAQAQKAQQDFLTQVEKVRDELPDFDAVMQEANDEYVAPHVEALIRKFGPASAYWIVKEDALDELNAMDIYDATIRIKELSSKAVAKPITKTPAPMSPVKGRGSEQPDILKKQSGDEILKWLRS
ncbi:hypothetical protein J0X19_11765 [Hymenobacter sp. BT186]|uniref:Uncharacterized protein n=1 Tax=Hymenobacter telluris TaxID=2816474 RepID=A0A939EWS4_9BACT|nr:hypothetical protein [Hymenobacter telluris]MBO0358624.1 hypothetical protein [Hymenobacter telluris]MBW3374650.1 hypothetical protein [Hymenobacter norwichensis]